MRFQVLASDFDETLADHGRATPETLAALERLRASGRRFVLVTGRAMHELWPAFPELASVCDAVVAENGALLYLPATKEERLLCEPHPPGFAERLAAEGVEPLILGKSIVATRVPHDAAVLRAIRELGLELEVIFNKGSVMVLPTGVTKGTGLRHALAELGLSPHNAAAVGDAENDHHLLSLVECGVSVANGLRALRERADLVTVAPAGSGVQELIHWMVEDDLARAAPRLARHAVALGGDVRLEPARGGLLFAGEGPALAAAAEGFAERCVEAGYQLCVVDPSGDFAGFTRAVRLGGAGRAPAPEEVARALAKPDEQVVVSLQGLPDAERPAWCAALLPRLVELRARTGRPHRLVLDEAHLLVPPGARLPEGLPPLLLVSHRPAGVAPEALAQVEAVLAAGERPERALAEAGRACGQAAPEPGQAGPGQSWLWRRGEARARAVAVQGMHADLTQPAGL